jgi:periplasmic protein TonB
MRPRSILLATCEIKRPYQRNLAIGFSISSFIPLLAAAIIVTYFQQAPIPIMPTHVGGPVQPITLSNNPLPKPIADPVRPINKPILNTGIPVPVPDKEAPIGIEIPTQKEYALYTPDEPVTDLGGGIVIDTNKVFETAFPPSDVFIPVDEQPVQVTIAQPKYPELARKAGIERKVFVKVLIDKDGSVKRVEVQNHETNDIGFESAAIEAAMQSTWRPAINNGQPVAVWVAYVVAFKLK